MGEKDKRIRVSAKEVVVPEMVHSVVVVLIVRQYEEFARLGSLRYLDLQLAILAHLCRRL